MTTAEDTTANSPLPFRVVSGTWVVVGVLLLGISATAVMFVYWDLHTKPFRPLTEAIGRTFKNSLPKVEGGRHKQGPKTLRIAFRVPFSPETDPQRTQETLDTVFDLIRRHQDLTGYEKVQIYLIQMVPEESAKKTMVEFTPEQIESAAGTPHQP